MKRGLLTPQVGIWAHSAKQAVESCWRASRGLAEAKAARAVMRTAGGNCMLIIVRFVGLEYQGERWLCVHSEKTYVKTRGGSFIFIIFKPL